MVYSAVQTFDLGLEENVSNTYARIYGRKRNLPIALERLSTAAEEPSLVGIREQLTPLLSRVSAVTVETAVVAEEAVAVAAALVILCGAVGAPGIVPGVAGAAALAALCGATGAPRIVPGVAGATRDTAGAASTAEEAAGGLCFLATDTGGGSGAIPVTESFETVPRAVTGDVTGETAGAGPLLVGVVVLALAVLAVPAAPRALLPVVADAV